MFSKENNDEGPPVSGGLFFIDPGVRGPAAGRVEGEPCNIWFFIVYFCQTQLMLKNYILVAWRNLLRSKWYSLINTVGLSIGIAVALLIGLWIWDELTYDHYHSNHERLARIMTTQTFNGHTGTGDAVAIPLGKELSMKYNSDLKYVSMASWNFNHILAVGDKKLGVEGMSAQPALPDMLSLKMLEGSRDALKDPSSILIAQSVARSLFGNAQTLGQIIKSDNKLNYKVAGVFEDLPRNSSFYSTKFLTPWDRYVSENDWVKRGETQWGNHSFQLFVQLQANVAPAKVTAKIKDLPKAHNKEGQEEILVQPMDNWRLHSDFKDGKVVGGRIQFVWLFGIIGLFVLLLACINFMNLSTARSEKRAKEVGIRKTVGSRRRQLIGQFLSESLVVALLAFILSIGWALLALPFFNSISDKEIHLPGRSLCSG